MALPPTEGITTMQTATTKFAAQIVETELGKLGRLVVID